MKIILIKIFIFFSIVASLVSCRQITVKIDKVPENTPKGADIYVAGNFNFWDPGDDRYIMNYDEKTGYSITLPLSFGNIEYKFTRGDWSTVERDRCGNDIPNRVIENFDQDIVQHKIESWADLEPLDCDSVLIVLTKLPANTPKNSTIRIAGNFNAWNPANDEQYILKKDNKTGHYTVCLRRKKGLLLKDFRYKIIRDSLSQSESDKFGNEMDLRSVDLSKSEGNHIEIENWTDLAEPSLNAVTIILTKIPPTTSALSEIYLAGNFNNWRPDDKNFRFRKNSKGIYYIRIPRLKYGLSFKVTRGGWHSEAADEQGINFENQDYNYDEIDTIYMKIDNWKDLRPKWSDYYTFIIEKIPPNTPEGQNLYLIGTYYEWNIIEKQEVFTQNAAGKYQLSVRKKDLDFEYKITRGNWQTQELTEQTQRIAHPWEDTIRISINKWSDQLKDRAGFVRIELTRLPRSTPANSRLYIAGGFNGWDPGDKNFRLEKDSKGIYYIELPRLWLKQGFKFTRGNWETVETKRLGGFVENRVYNGNASILKIEIAGWED